MTAGRAQTHAACPGDEVVAKFVDGLLADADDDAMRSHVERCADCRRVVAQVGAGRASRITPAHDVAPPTALAHDGDVVGPGAIIGGKYQVLRLLGTGGMGKVFAARHVELGQTVAVKVMHPEMVRELDAVKRFLREGRAAASLKSDHAVRIHDVGKLPSGLPYLVMEHLDGQDLDVARKSRTLGVYEVVDYALQALLAIIEAHAAGLVHRDIKPQNLFLARLQDGHVRVKVLDFGLAKELPKLESSNSALTTENMLLGSPHFMSPEQIRSPRAVDTRTDIWALGATMFQLITGKPPYSSGTVHGLLARILADPAPRARSLRPEVPQVIDDIIARCMEKNVLARFQTTTELAAALRAARGAPLDASAPLTEVEGAPPSMPMDDDLPTMAESARTVVEGRPHSPPLPHSPPHPHESTRASAQDIPRAITLESAGFEAAPAHTVAMPTRRADVAAAEQPRPLATTLPRAMSAPAAAMSAAAVAPGARSTVSRPVSRSGLRWWTAAFVAVSIAATIVVVLVLRAAHRRDARTADAASLVTSPASSTAPSAAPSAVDPPLDLPRPSASPSAASPPSATPAASAPAVAASSGSKRPPRAPATTPTSTARAPAEADPYSWGK